MYYATPHYLYRAMHPLSATMLCKQTAHPILGTEPNCLKPRFPAKLKENAPTMPHKLLKNRARGIEKRKKENGHLSSLTSSRRQSQLWSPSNT